jgi:hypothetical protein
VIALDLHADLIVSTPDLCEWNDGEPVRVIDAHPARPGRMWVLWQDVRARYDRHGVDVPIGMQLTLISGGHGRAA